MMSICEDATVADKVMVWRRDEGDEFCEELLWGHVDGAGFARKVQSNAAIGQPLDGLGGEGGSQEIAAARTPGPMIRRSPVDGSGRREGIAKRSSTPEHERRATQGPGQLFWNSDSVSTIGTLGCLGEVVRGPSTANRIRRPRRADWSPDDELQAARRRRSIKSSAEPRPHLRHRSCVRSAGHVAHDARPRP